MSTKEAQRRAVAEFRKRQAAAGLKLKRVWISPEADADLTDLAVAYGSKDRAVDAAVKALWRSTPKEHFDPVRAAETRAWLAEHEPLQNPPYVLTDPISGTLEPSEKAARARVLSEASRAAGKSSKPSSAPSVASGVPVPTYVRRGFNPQPKTGKPKGSK